MKEYSVELTEHDVKVLQEIAYIDCYNVKLGLIVNKIISQVAKVKE